MASDYSVLEKGFASVCRPRCNLGALRLLRCHRGEALRDPAGHLRHDGLGHLWEVLVQGVVASLVDLHGGKGRGSQGGSAKSGSSNEKSDFKSNLSSMLSDKVILFC